MIAPDEKHATTLTNLKSFGDVAAEDDAVLDYFLTTDAVARIKGNEAFLVLGRKGAGKTAIVRYFAEGEGRAYSKALNLRGYPWAIHAQRVDRGASEIEAYVSTWRYLISLQLATLAVSRAKSQDHPQAKAVQSFLRENYGGVDPVLGDLLKPGRLRLSSMSFEPEVLGCKLGGIDLERKRDDLTLGSELNALSDLLLNAAIVLATDAHSSPDCSFTAMSLIRGFRPLTNSAVVCSSVSSWRREQSVMRARPHPYL